MRTRGKDRAVARDPKASMCVLDERWPLSYLQVYCDAVIDDEKLMLGDNALLDEGVIKLSVGKKRHALIKPV